PCEDCITGSPYQGAIHGCYRESRIGSLPVARMIATHRRQGTWNSQVGRFIALSDFAKSRFVRAGFEAERIVVKPNFVSDPGVAERSSGPRRAVYVGRLSPEKGIRTLVRAWRELDLELRVIGDGPLESELRASAPSQVTFLGRLAPEEVLGEMRGASFLVVPSECYENFPLVIAEAYAAGLPVLASNLGSVAEVVEPGVHGERFVPGDADDLAAAARRLTAGQADLAKFARNCRRTYEEKYSPETNLRKLLTIYESLVNLPAQP
ncbi:MAG: glycosyltransferase, partial [Bdellovibrionota bacterium]